MRFPTEALTHIQSQAGRAAAVAAATVDAEQSLQVCGHSFMLKCWDIWCPELHVQSQVAVWHAGILCDTDWKVDMGD